MTQELTTTQNQSHSLSLPITEKASLLKSLVTDIPNNKYGLPDYIYRTDLIPNDLNDLDAYSEKERQDTLECAVLELDYTQGYPMLPDGEPFWAKLPFEPEAAHRVFIMYLDMPRKGTDLSAPVRQFHVLKTSAAMSTSELLSMSHMYYWGTRARAYDLFITATHNKQKEYKLLEAENKHLRMAGEYIELANNFLKKVFADPETHGMKPKDAMDLMIKMIQVERLSLGTTPFGSANTRDKDGVPNGASIQVILQHLVQQAGGADANNNANQNASMEALFDDPEALEAAQKLIIKMRDHSNPRVMPIQYTDLKEEDV